MIAFKFTTATGAPVLRQVPQGYPTGLIGLCATTSETVSYYLKFYWQGGSTTSPVLGTTVPNLTVPVSSTTLGAGQIFSLPLSINMGQQLYYAATLLPADTDTTALTSGNEQVTLFLN